MAFLGDQGPVKGRGWRRVPGTGEMLFETRRRKWSLRVFCGGIRLHLNLPQGLKDPQIGVILEYWGN